MLLLRAHVLALGHSGVRPEVVDLMVEMLNQDVIPAVPRAGLARRLGRSRAAREPRAPADRPRRACSTPEGGVEPRRAALRRAGLAPLALEAKEGLALVNGTQGMLAVGMLAAARAASLARTADVVAAMTIEAALGTDAPFDERLQRLRPHPGPGGQRREPAAAARRLADPRVAPRQPAPGAGRVLAAVRAAGARRDARRARATSRASSQIEANACRDNPIVLPDDDEVRTGGNFHGQPVAVAMDALAPRSSRSPRSASDASTGCSMRSRRTACPRSWCTGSGLNSGFMLVQYTAASLVSECKSLAHPASVDSIPSSAGPGGPREHGDDRGAPRAGDRRRTPRSSSRWRRSPPRRRSTSGRRSSRGRPRARCTTRSATSVPFFEADREFGPDIADASRSCARARWWTRPRRSPVRSTSAAVRRARFTAPRPATTSPPTIVATTGSWPGRYGTCGEPTARRAAAGRRACPGSRRPEPVAEPEHVRGVRRGGRERLERAPARRRCTPSRSPPASSRRARCRG